MDQPAHITCPLCGVPFATSARKCPACGEAVVTESLSKPSPVRPVAHLAFRFVGALYFVAVAIACGVFVVVLLREAFDATLTVSQSIVLKVMAFAPALLSFASLWGAVWIAVGKANPFRTRR